ncbi:hypothetical protein LY78DRAFT_248465 [Colletotrichum sublineola]|nr:hypothetical protein LY78DRAFT_248465 [Colletotrichum sublineola]
MKNISQPSPMQHHWQLVGFFCFVFGFGLAMDRSQSTNRSSTKLCRWASAVGITMSISMQHFVRRSHASFGIFMI